MVETSSPVLPHLELLLPQYNAQVTPLAYSNDARPHPDELAFVGGVRLREDELEACAIHLQWFTIFCSAAITHFLARSSFRRLSIPFAQDSR